MGRLGHPLEVLLAALKSLAAAGIGFHSALEMLDSRSIGTPVGRQLLALLVEDGEHHEQ